MISSFRAFMVRQEGTSVTAGMTTLALDDLPEGDVLVEVHYSSVNYKDALACSPDGRVARRYPLIPGIDLAGVVLSSANPRFREGDEVIATGYELGVSHAGGYSPYTRLPGDWLVPLPDGMTLKEAMIYGTAGFTAALSVHRMEQCGIRPDGGKLLVTGATGGVGSMAVSMLSRRGYEVTASTGKAAERDYLTMLGAREIISRDEVSGGERKALGKARWQGAVDPVGGGTLAALLSQISYGGCVAVSGLTGGSAVETTVFPFILRGVSLLGIDSVYCPKDVREEIWRRLATDLRPRDPALLLEREIALEELPDALAAIRGGQARGRTVVKCR